MSLSSKHGSEGPFHALVSIGRERRSWAQPGVRPCAFGRAAALLFAAGALAACSSKSPAQATVGGGSLLSSDPTSSGDPTLPPMTGAPVTGAPMTGSNATGNGTPSNTGATGLDGLIQDDGTDPGSSCTDQFATATARSPVIQFVVDTSGSMDWVPGTEQRATGNEQSKWDITAAALGTAIAAMPSDAAVGVSYFPNVLADNASCYVPDVAPPIAKLSDAQRLLIQAAIDARTPVGGTPTEAAYDFGVKQLEATSFEGPRFLLLMTDGTPTYTVDCGGDGRVRVDGAPLIAKVGAHFKDDEISTFVIGSPGSEDARDELSQMASVGGTGTPGCSNSGPQYCHFDMTQEPDFSVALNAALKQITQSTLACDYGVPPAPGGLMLDYDQVSVVVESGATQVREFTRATGSCDSGWQYSDDRKSIHLCSATCTDLQALLATDPDSSVRVKFGCSVTPRYFPRVCYFFCEGLMQPLAPRK